MKRVGDVIEVQARTLSIVGLNLSKSARLEQEIQQADFEAIYRFEGYFLIIQVHL